MSVSIIIPVQDDNKELAKLLGHIRNWIQQPHEIIVVDAKADMECNQLCQKFSATWLAFNKTRGAQQRFGAQHASGDALWFVYADCRPDSGSLKAIDEALQSNQGGFFQFSFDLDKKNLTQRILEFFINWRSRRFIAYGDQGLFFDKRSYFVLDGHADQTLFEEVSLIRKMKKLGFSQLELPIKISARKWQQDGFWKRTWHNRLFALRYWMGTPADELKKLYYSEQN